MVAPSWFAHDARTALGRAPPVQHGRSFVGPPNAQDQPWKLKRDVPLASGRVSVFGPGGEFTLTPTALDNGLDFSARTRGAPEVLKMTRRQGQFQVAMLIASRGGDAPPVQKMWRRWRAAARRASIEYTEARGFEVGNDASGADRSAVVAAIGDARAAAVVAAAARQHDRRLRRYLAQLLGVTDSEDAAQEVYARLLHVARDGRSEPFSLTYIKRTAESAALDILRRRRVRQSQRHVELDEQIAAVDPTPIDNALGRQSLQHLKQAMMALPTLQRRILLMHRFDDMSLAEVAIELGMPLRTVQRHMMQGLAACRLHMQHLGWLESE